MPLPVGTRFGPYEITSALGAGGMGEVYRAKDTRLDRAVAIKVLPSHLSSDAEARARFDREARAIAALNHPNICTLYDVGLIAAGDGPAAGGAYLVMELLEGETLQKRLLRGPIEVGPLVDYALALTDALDTAHARGLIHRDLKPANIFLTSRGVPKLLDFGLAKAVDALDDATRQADALTGLGTTVGTIAYMSPEQLRADLLDPRTDIFSLGLVLYEMATGQRAFAGATTAVVSAAILAQEPAPPRSIRADVPPRLEETILKALEKDRTLRCQSAAELRADLLRTRRQSATDSGSMTQAPGYAAAAKPPSGSAAVRPTATDAVPLPAEPDSRAQTPGETPAAGSFVARYKLALAAVVVLILMGVVAAAWKFGTSQAGAPAPFGTISSTTPQGAEPAGPPLQAASPPPQATRDTSAPSAGPSSPPAGRRSDAPVDTGRSAPPDSRGGSSTAREAAPPSPVVAEAQPAADTSARGRGAGRAGAGRGRGTFALALVNLTNTLKALPPRSCEIFAVADPRVRTFAGELENALTNAGWTCANGGAIPDDGTAFAIQVPRATPSATALLNWAKRLGFNPDYRVAPRLKQIRIAVGLLRPE